MRGRRRVVLALVVVVVLGAVGGLLVYVTRTPAPPPLTRAERQALAAERAAKALLKLERGDATRAEQLISVRLPEKSGEPVPATDGSLFAHPLKSHEVVSFVPYYTMADVVPADLTLSSVVIYSSLCVGSNGALSESGVDCENGWNDLHSGSFSTLVEDAHDAGDRVLLSVSAFDNSSINSMLRQPTAAAKRLALDIVPVVQALGLDGVNIDIEGSSPSEARAFVTFVHVLTDSLRATDPAWELVLDSFADSAAPPPGFFDIRGLAPLVDRIFIEGYQMNEPANASANSPLVTNSLGYSAAQTLVQYERQAPADELILGLPFYGLDFTTVGRKPGALFTGAGPESYTYQAIVQANRTPQWDPSSETPFAVFKKGAAWHQLWYDDPLSIALKVALASNLNTAGVGAWALGMEGGSTAMLDALTGGSPVKKLPLAGASS